MAANKGRSVWQRRNGTASLLPAAIHLLMAVQMKAFSVALCNTPPSIPVFLLFGFFSLLQGQTCSSGGESAPDWLTERSRRFTIIFSFGFFCLSCLVRDLCNKSSLAVDVADVFAAAPPCSAAPLLPAWPPLSDCLF